MLHANAMEAALDTQVILEARDWYSQHFKGDGGGISHSRPRPHTISLL